MHYLEPYYRWRDLYISSEDENSPFYNREYSEFEYTNNLYDHAIHPQWDEFGSPTLYMKMLYASYEDGFVIIELLGEWNDAIHNDIMFMKRDVVEQLTEAGISKFILIGENVLNFHASDDSYYEDWYTDIEEDGWIAFINFREHVLREFRSSHIDYYVNFGGALDELSWRTLSPARLFDAVSQIVSHRLG
jgi:hypothetical protein